MLAVQRAGANKGVDARPRCRFQGLSRPLNILGHRARQGAHHGLLNLGGNLRNRIKIAG
jgi:hypothetical protein